MPAHASRTLAPAPSAPPSGAERRLLAPARPQRRPANADTPVELSGSPAPRLVKLRSVDSELSPTWTSLEWPGTDGIGVADALREAGVSDRVLVIYEWDEAAQTWKGFFPGLEDVPGFNTLTTLRHGHTYWVAVTEPLTWTVATAEPAGDEPSGEANP